MADLSVFTTVKKPELAMLADEEEEEIYRIADNTHEVSVEDLYSLATPRKKRPPVYRIPTSNTPKRFIVPQARTTGRATPDNSPLSEPEISLPSLPSLSRLCSGSQENLLDVSIDSLSSTPTKVRMPPAESMTIEEILQRGTLDNACLLDLDMNVSASADDLLWE